MLYNLGVKRRSIPAVDVFDISLGGQHRHLRRLVCLIFPWARDVPWNCVFEGCFPRRFEAGHGFRDQVLRLSIPLMGYFFFFLFFFFLESGSTVDRF